MLDSLKSKLIEIGKQAQRLGLCKHKSGNFSILDKETGYIVVSPTSIDRELLQIEQVCVMTLDGEIIEGNRPSSETMMHLEIYKARKDVNAVVHTHSKFATAFAVLNKPIPAVVFEAATFGLKKGYIPVAQYARPGTVELSKSVIEPIQIADMILLEKHGAVSVGTDLEDAFLKAQYIEEVAEIYYLALNINKGVEPDVFSVEELDRWRYPEKFN